MSYTLKLDPANTTVTGIDISGAFNGVVIIPSGITTIASCAFSGLINISSGFTTLTDNLFSAPALTSITFPISLTTIQVNAFYGCTNLSSVTFLGTACTVDATEFTGIATSYADVSSGWIGNALIGVLTPRRPTTTASSTTAASTTASSTTAASTTASSTTAASTTASSTTASATTDGSTTRATTTIATTTASTTTIAPISFNSQVNLLIRALSSSSNYRDLSIGTGRAAIITINRISRYSNGMIGGSRAISLSSAITFQVSIPDNNNKIIDPVNVPRTDIYFVAIPQQFQATYTFVDTTGAISSDDTIVAVGSTGAAGFPAFSIYYNAVGGTKTLLNGATGASYTFTPRNGTAITLINSFFGYP